MGLKDYKDFLDEGIKHPLRVAIILLVAAVGVFGTAYLSERGKQAAGPPVPATNIRADPPTSPVEAHSSSAEDGSHPRRPDAQPQSKTANANSSGKVAESSAQVEGTQAENTPNQELLTVQFRPRSSNGVRALRVQMNGAPVGEIVFAPQPRALVLKGPPGEWRLAYDLVGVGHVTTHSYYDQYGKEFFVESSGLFDVDAYDDRQGRYGVTIVRDPNAVGVQ